MPIAVVVVVVPVMPIRVIIVTVTRIIAAVIRSVIAVIGWNTKSNSYMHSSLGLTWRPGNQTERDER